MDPDVRMKHSRKPRNTHCDKQTDLLHRNLWTFSFQLWNMCEPRKCVFIKFKDSKVVNLSRGIARLVD